MKKTIFAAAALVTLFSMQSASAQNYVQTGNLTSNVVSPIQNEVAYQVQDINVSAYNAEQAYAVDKDMRYQGDLSILGGVTGVTAATATVSSCPAGTTKSSDGCCCINK